MRSPSPVAIWIGLQLSLLLLQATLTQSDKVENTELAAFARAKRVRRVIGGQGVSDGQYPWLVSMRGKIKSGWWSWSYKYIYCGGSVLSDRWILSAAHCYESGKAKDPKIWHARLASVKLRSNIFEKILGLLGRIFGKTSWKQWELHVKRIVIHPYYDSKNAWINDIALIELDKPVPSGSDVPQIQKIDLPEQNDMSFPGVGTTCVAKGWGCSQNGGTVEKKARSVNLEILPTKSCSIYDVRGDTRLCVGKSGSSICQGDSGGPLVCEKNGGWVQAGVASFIHGTNPSNNPNVFVRVSKYTDWIKQTTGLK